MPHPRSDADNTPTLGAADLAAFENSAAASIADELRAALEPGIHLLRPLGAGAMGLVFLGRDPLLKRLVAIKVLSPHLAGDDVAHERFIRESEASAANWSSKTCFASNSSRPMSVLLPSSTLPQITILRSGAADSAIRNNLPASSSPSSPQRHRR